ncbi:MAG TPA: hypothetical protein VEG24_01060, partial [Gaiellaceae bacterium]|nr:hypothetical protein [Gaiellaceae bacterium]
MTERWAWIAAGAFIGATLLLLGWLVIRLRHQSDRLEHRADALEAANRCARALSSSLDLDQAFDAFIREVRGLVPFDRIAI